MAELSLCIRRCKHQLVQELTSGFCACSAEHGCVPADWQDISFDNEHSWSCEGLDADRPLSPDVCFASNSTKLGGLLYSIPGSVLVQLQKTSVHEEGTACGI